MRKGRLGDITLNKTSPLYQCLYNIKVSIYFGPNYVCKCLDVLKIEIWLYMTALGKQAGVILVNIIMTLDSHYLDAVFQKQHPESKFLFLLSLQKSLFCC